MPLPAVIEALDKVDASHHKFAAETWQIVAVDPIYSGDSVAAYRLQLRN